MYSETERTAFTGTLCPKTAIAAVAQRTGEDEIAARTRRKKWETTRIAWLMILPAFAFLCVFTLYPIANTMYTSLFHISLSSVHPTFAGLDNYKSMLHDEVFQKAFVNNLIIAGVTIPCSIALAVAMAVFANKARFLQGFVKVAFFYPTLLPVIAAANIWLFIYTPQYGLLGQFFGNANILGSTQTALAAVIIMLIWKESGYIMIFYLAGLQGISRELYEAARIDGANAWHSFRSITWPLLRPTTLFVSIVTLTNSFKIVDHLYIMTKGGPSNATNMLLFYIYQTGFEFWDIGRASAMTTVLVLLLIVVAMGRFFSQDKKIFYS
ncbi:MAG: carbohydrate ABC transporter permease [Acetanaerobacterium sp.]